MFTSFVSFIKSRANSLALILISSIVFLPWASKFIQTIKSGILSYPSFQRDEMHYVARARAGWENRNLIEVFSNSNHYSTDGLMQPLEYMLFNLLRPLKILQIDFVYAYLFVVLVTVIICTWAVYNFFLEFTHSKSISFASTSLLYFNDIFEKWSTQPSEALLVSRWPFPMIHYFVIFQFLRLILIRKNVGSLDGIKLSLLVALGFYSYFYTWQVLGALILAMLLIFLLRGEKQLFSHLFRYALLGAFLAIPYLYKQINSLHPEELELSQLFLQSMGKFQTRQIQVTVSMLILLFVAIYLKTTAKTQLLDLASIVTFSSILIYNQQVITGIQIQPGHYHWYWIKPMSFVLIFLVLTREFLKKDYRKLFASFLAIFLVILSIFQNTMYSEYQPTRDISIAMSRIDYKSLSGVVFTNSEMVSDVLVTESVVQVDWHTFSKFYRGQDLSFREGFDARQVFNDLGVDDSNLQIKDCAQVKTKDVKACERSLLKVYVESRKIKWIIITGEVSRGQAIFLAEDFDLVSQSQPVSVFKSRVNH